MPFSVKIIYRAEGQPPRETLRSMSRAKFTIGRAPDCDIVLDDPKRYVSRVHATVAWRDDAYVLSVVSKVNFVLVNGRQFGPNTATPVHPGDKVDIGQYLLEVLPADTTAASLARTVALDKNERTVPRAAPSAVAGAQVVPPRGKGLIASFAEEEAPAPPPPAPAAARPPAGAAPTLPEDRLMRAFLDGAGLADLKPAAPPEKLMRECGALLRAGIEGIIVLLMARAEMKKEMRSEDRTMVNAQNNNPLKLMTDAQEALGYLLDPQAPEGAFLPPLRAVKDACDELRSHDLALMAAMRAAIMGAIERFDPARIEELLVKTRGGITLNRKAALWEVFVAEQAKLLRETEDDFNQTFSKEFLGTYTAQVKRLRGK